MRVLAEDLEGLVARFLEKTSAKSAYSGRMEVGVSSNFSDVI